MIVLMTVLLTGQRRGATRQGNGIRHIVIMVVAVLRRPIMLGQPVIMVPIVVLPEVMRLGPMRMRHPVRHGQAGRREAGDQRQQDDGPAGPGGSGHSRNVYPRRGAPRECDHGQRGNGFSATNSHEHDSRTPDLLSIGMIEVDDHVAAPSRCRR
jgi:hypothetical protein